MKVNDMRIAFILLFALPLALAGCQSNPPTPATQSQPGVPLASQLKPAPPVQLAQDPITPRQRAETHAELAAGYFERAQMNVALEELALAEKLDPTYARVYNLYGLIYATLGDLQQAEAQFKRALDLAPNDAEVRHNWGWYLCTNGRARESIGEFEIAIRNPLYRTPEIALVNAGKCSAATGDVAAAELYFRRALQMRPNDPTAAYNLALLSFKGGRLPESRALMRIVMQQNTPAPEALFLGMCVERRLADRQAEQSYIAQLRNRYPDSAETRAIASSACE
ncbi:MAG TPA: type IV pilus biogenesis/stability protein PilW [Casimicrobiaceae bacterium]|nr:type IV pilus biogenesis/stability protein PilW [Casimicrobiaceae bacterium]